MQLRSGFAVQHSLCDEFYAYYTRRAASIDVCASCMALVVKLVLLLNLVLNKAALQTYGQSTALQDDCFCVRMAAIITTLILCCVLGKEQYARMIGPNSVWQRMLFAAGFMFRARPGDRCSWEWIWRHRLLFVHVALAAKHTPANWYWLGGIVSVFTAAMVDVVDPTEVSSRKVMQLTAELQAAVSKAPWQFFLQVLQAIRSNSSVYLVDVVLPGVLMTWLEHKSYKQWSQRQLEYQRRQMPAASSSAAVAGATSRPRHHRQGSNSNSHDSSMSHDSDSTDYARYAASDLSIGPRALCFGFPDPTVEAAYNAYKSAMFHGHDLFSSAVYTFLSIACIVKVVLLWHSIDKAAMPAALLRTFYMTLLASNHISVCVAAWKPQLAWLQQWRSAILYGGVILGQSITILCSIRGGVWAAASSAAITEYFASPLLLLVFRHIVQPCLLGANITPTTVLYLQFQFLVFDDFYGRPQVLGLGPHATAFVFVGVHLAVTFELEVRVRKRFVQSQLPAYAM